MGLNDKINEIKDELDGAVEGIKALADEKIAKLEREAASMKDQVDEFVDTNIEPIADKVKPFMDKYGQKIVLGTIIAVGVVVLITLANDYLPKFLF